MKFVYQSLNKEQRMNFIFDQKLKGLMTEGIKVGTVWFAMGKLRVLKNLRKKYGIEDPIMDEGGIHFILWLRKYNLDLPVLWLLKKWLIVKYWLFNKQKIHEVDGLKFILNYRDIKSAGIFKEYELVNIWEEETTKIVKDNVKKGDMCLDIGASMGYFTMQFARLGARAIGIEPTQRCFKYMKRNVKLNGFKDQCKLYKMAAWDRQEIVKMPANDPNPMIARGTDVDSLLEELGVYNVDFIKIDVDGPEPKVLRGLERTFQRSKNLKMVIEFYPKYIEMADCSPGEFIYILNKYFTFDIIPNDYSGTCVNLFCIRK